MAPRNKVRIVTSGISDPVREVIQGPYIPVEEVTTGPSDPVRIVTHGPFTPIKIQNTRIILSESFITEYAVNLVNGTMPDPGPGGARNVTDTGNFLSISGGKLIVSNGTFAIGDPGINYAQAIQRAAGVTPEFEATLGAGNEVIGLSKISGSGWAMNGGFRWTAGSIWVSKDDGSIYDTGKLSGGTSKRYKVVLKDVGYIVYYSTDGGINYLRLYEDYAEMFTPLYFHILNFNDAFSMDFANIYQGTVLTPFHDTFNRTNGSLGISPDGLLWQPSGSNIPTILDGNMVITPGGGEGYGFVELPGTPTSMTGYITWTGGVTRGNNAIVFISSHKDFGLTDIMHLGFSPEVWFLQTRHNGGAFVNLGGANYSSPMVKDKTYLVGMEITGNTVRVLLPDGTTVDVTDASIGSEKGPFCCYELTSADPLSWCPGFKSVHAEY